MSFLEALIAGCVGGFIVFMMTRRASDGGSASTTTEIDRLRAVVEELTAALEGRAEAAEQRLGRVISEAQAVQNVLDRALASIGAQIVRPESTSKPEPPVPAASFDIEERRAVAETVPADRARPEPAAATTIRSMADDEPSTPADPAARIDLATPPVADAPRPVISPLEAPMRAKEPTAPVAADAFVPEPIIAAAELRPSATNNGEGAGVSEATAAAVEPTVEVRAEAAPPALRQEPISHPAPAPLVEAAHPASAPIPPSKPASTLGRDPRDTAEREAQVMSLVARGVADSVDLARQTGLTRGEVELILTLHNLHIAPAPVVARPSAPEALAPGQPTPPEPAVAEPAVVNAAEAQQEASPATPEDRYAAIYSLIAAGITDSVEIARRTGLGRGEVELHMGLHARNVL